MLCESGRPSLWKSVIEVDLNLCLRWMFIVLSWAPVAAFISIACPVPSVVVFETRSLHSFAIPLFIN
jgi:hypothetical protein